MSQPCENIELKYQQEYHECKSVLHAGISLQEAYY